MLKAALRLLLLFVAMLLIGIPVLKWRADHQAPAPGHRRVVLQVTEKGQFKYFQVRLLSAEGQSLFAKRSGFHRDYHDVPAAAAVLRIEEGTATRPAPPAKGQAAPAPPVWKVLRELPLPPARGAGAMEVFVDVDPAYDVSRIGMFEAMVSSQPTGLKVGMALALVTAFLVFVLAPISIGAAAYVLLKERQAGIRRWFCGSWVQFLLGLGWLGAGFHFGIIQGWFPPKSFLSLVGIFLLPGYPLFYFAKLDFNPEEAARERAVQAAELEAQSQTFTYTETYRDGRKVGDDRASKAMGGFLGLMLFYLLKPLFLPIVTFGGLFIRFTLPLLAGRKPWLEGQPAPERSLAEELRDDLASSDEA